MTAVSSISFVFITLLEMGDGRLMDDYDFDFSQARDCQNELKKLLDVRRDNIEKGKKAQILVAKAHIETKIEELSNHVKSLKS